MKSIDACSVIRSVLLDLDNIINRKFDLCTSPEVQTEINNLKDSKLKETVSEITSYSDTFELEKDIRELNQDIWRFQNKNISILTIETEKKEALEKVGYYEISILDRGETYLLANSIINQADVITDDYEAYSYCNDIKEKEVYCLIEIIGLKLDGQREKREEAIKILDSCYANYDELSPEDSERINTIVERFSQPLVESI